MKLNADAACQAAKICVQLCMYRGEEMSFWHLQRHLTKNRLKPMNLGAKVVVPKVLLDASFFFFFSPLRNICLVYALCLSVCTKAGCAHVGAAAGWMGPD